MPKLPAARRKHVQITKRIPVRDATAVEAAHSDLEVLVQEVLAYADEWNLMWWLQELVSDRVERMESVEYHRGLDKDGKEKLTHLRDTVKWLANLEWGLEQMKESLDRIDFQEKLAGISATVHEW